MIRGFVPLPVFLAILALLWWRVTYCFDLCRGKRKVLAFFLTLIPLYFILIAVIFKLSQKRELILLNGFLMGFLLLYTLIIPFEAVFAQIFRKRKKIIIAVSLIITFFLTVYGITNVTKMPESRELRVSVKNLPAALRGLKIVHLTDLHICSTFSIAKLNKIVNRVNRTEPDLVFITGDMVSALRPRDLANYKIIIAKLSAKLGIFAVRGNHEFNNSGRTFRTFVNGTGINVLENENIILKNGLQIAGVDDPRGKNSPDMPGGMDLNKALQGLDMNKPVILLSHRPKVFDNAAERGVGLVLAGHTHAGQFPPVSWISRLFHKYFLGVYKKKNSLMIVSPGTGTWDYLPLRLFSKNLIYFLCLKNCSSMEEIVGFF